MEAESELEQELEVLSHKWNKITEVIETPRSTMNVVEYSLGSQRKAEVYTNRILRYFLDPEESHGMNNDLLRVFLDALPDECGFDEDTYDLSNVEVNDQVRLYRGGDGETVFTGDVDLVVESPNEWFLMVEIKFSAGENNLRGEELSQTEKYYAASHIGSTPKKDYESGRYYLYIHPSDEPCANDEEFTNWTWGEVVDDVLKEFIVEYSSRYPQRTVAQLHEFIDDIQEITGMTERHENEREKVELYLKHYEAIEDVTDTFDERWEDFALSWGDRLTNSLAENYSDIAPLAKGLPDRVVKYLEERGTGVDHYTAVRTRRQDTTNLWLFRAWNSDWGILFKEGWWKQIDRMEPVYEREDNQAWIGYHHRPWKHKDRAIGEKELVLQLRNMSNSDQRFRDAFSREFYSRENEINDVLPQVAETTGNKGDMTKAVYDIHVDSHDDIFEAYTDALKRAFKDHVIDKPELVKIIDEVYEDAVERI